MNAECRCVAPLPTYIHDGRLHPDRRCLLCGGMLARLKVDGWLRRALVIYVLFAAIALVILAWKVWHVR